MTRARNQFGVPDTKKNMEVVQNHSFRISSIHRCPCREDKKIANCTSLFAQTRYVKPGVAYLQAEAGFDMYLLIGRLLRHCVLWTLGAWLLPGRIQLLGQTPLRESEAFDKDRKHLSQFPINPWMEHFQNV